MDRAAVYKTAPHRKAPSGAGVADLGRGSAAPAPRPAGLAIDFGKERALRLAFRSLTCAVISCGLSCEPSRVVLPPGGG